MFTIDATDARILSALQVDATASLDTLGAAVGLSRNGVWRRIRALEERGILKGRVAVLDADALGLGLQVFIQIRAAHHTEDWLSEFRAAVRTIPEIQGAFRMSGDLDYLIRARVADMAAYDALYKRLIARVALADVSASFVMEELKDTNALPV